MTNGVVCLRKRLEENKLQDVDDLLFYIADSSRLLSLGDSSYFNELANILKTNRLHIDLNEVLIERCQRGIFDLNQQLGKELGLTIIEAQDFYIFYRHGKKYINSKARRWFNKWRSKANEVSINNETADILERFLKTFPLTEDDQLAVVNSPVTESMYSMLEMVFPGYRNMSLEEQLRIKLPVKLTITSDESKQSE